MMTSILASFNRLETGWAIPYNRLRRPKRQEETLETNRRH